MFVSLLVGAVAALTVELVSKQIGSNKQLKKLEQQELTLEQQKQTLNELLKLLSDNQSKNKVGKNDFEMFIKYLVEERNYDDSNVLLFYSIFKNDPSITKEALDNGADPNCTDKMIIEGYQNEYREFLEK